MFSQRLVRAFQMKRQHLAPQTRGQYKSDIPTILRHVGGLHWVEPIYHRMEAWSKAWFNELRWQEKKIVEGRFFSGTLQYVPTGEVPIYYQALTPKIELNAADLRLLDHIEENGPLSRDEVMAGCGSTAGLMSKRATEESLRRLDLTFKVVRVGWIETRTWGQPLWDACEKWLPEEIDLGSVEPERAKEELVLKFLKSNGPLSIFQLASLFKASLKPKELKQILERLEARGLIISGGFVEGISDEQYAIEDYIALLSSEAGGAEGTFQQEFVRILGQGDPFVTVWSRELLELFGMRRPSARGPAHLAYIFLSETPVGVVDYKWRVKVSQINNIRLLPECYEEGALTRIAAELESEVSKMKLSIDVHSFLSLVPPSGLWEAYIQGRKAIHVEYGNIHSAEPRLKLAPISRWGGRITAFDRRERFIVKGDLDLKAQALRGKNVVSRLHGDFFSPEETHTLREEVEAKKDPCSLPAEELWEWIRQRLEWLIERLQNKRYQVKVWSGWEFRGYYNSLGSALTSAFPLSKLKIGVRVGKSGLIKRAGAQQGIEFFENLPHTLVEDFLQDVQQAETAREEKPIPDVLILDPEATAMLIHEAIGHSSEGDHVLADNSYLPALLGRRIAPSGVTIVDSPKDFSSLGSYPFDDEGTLVQTTPLVERGIVCGYLTDRSAGICLGLKSTGNSRSFWYDATPKVRMSNLVMLPGVRNFESILSETKEGLLVKGMREGGCDESTGDFHFKPNIAYRISDGELKEVVLISEIKGNALVYLKAITNVSSEWSLCVAGCGKPTPQSDYVWVGYGGAIREIRVRIMSGI